MKYLFLIFLLAVIGFVGFGGYVYISKNSAGLGSQREESKSGMISETGTVQKLAKPGDDYTHMLRTAHGMIKLNSYTVKLNQYEDTTITVEGQYSGNTLFVDRVR